MKHLQARRKLALLLAVLLVATLLPMTGFAADGYPDGVYCGAGAGRNGDITLLVTVTDGTISAIDVVSQNETPGYWEDAVVLLQRIIDANSPEVDSISGATLSCDGIKDAVRDALAAATDEIRGSGTKADPYVIRTAGQLQQFAARVDAGDASFANAAVLLGADIDLSGIENFNPIGAEGKASASKGKLFSGSFNGGGHTISSLTIKGDYESEANVGLFSTLGSTAQIENVTLSDVSIDVAVSGTFAQIRAGGIAGDTERTENRTAVADGCVVSGSIRVKASDGQAYAGGILGRAYTGFSMVNCVSYGDAAAFSVGNYNAAYAGSIAGATGNHTVLTNCAAFGNAAAENTSGGADAYAGGVAGMLSSETYNIYALGSASVTQMEGVTPQAVGAIAGQASGSASGSRIYYASDAVVTANGAAVAAAAFGDIQAAFANDAVVSMARADMAQSVFADQLNGSIAAIQAALYAPSLTLCEWALSNGRVLPTDTPWTPGEIDAGIFEAGSGTQDDPFIIKTKEQLIAFAASVTPKVDYTDQHLRLGADIDISGADWEPIGGSFARFNGCFDGAGKTITGLSEGTADAPRTLDGESAYIGLFGWLNEKAVVRNLTLDQVAIYTRSTGSAYVGGIAGRMSGLETEGDYRGVLVDGCVVKGVISHTTEKGTSFIGGVGGHVFKGTIINTMTDVNATGVELSGELVEVGGIVGLLNRGVVANCCALGNLTGSGYRDTQYDIEGMANVGNLAGVNGGYLVNCYGEGGVEALEYSIDTGVLAGWVTGIAKVYDCWYNEEARMVIDGRTVYPVDPFGETVAGGVSDEYDFAFPGSLLENNNGYRPGADGARQVADGLNANFDQFPIDLQGLYGLPADCLRTWTVKGDRADLSDAHARITYVQPEVEKIITEQPESALLDGVWYGRSADQSTVVSITVKDGEVTEINVKVGAASGENYDAALARARFKAAYGDTTDYSQTDAVHFAGSGTQTDPYLITSEADLRALSASIDEDVDWAGVWFRQTKDITLKGGDWSPIGWGIFADVDGDGFGQDVAALYPFRGNYDGGNHVIRGLSAGSPEHFSSNSWVGLFGVIQGDYTDNEIPAGDVRTATLRNIRLEDVGIYTEGRWRNYVGGLVGNAQGGFLIDHCSVTGTIVSRSTEDFAFAGGLTGSLMYGLVSNCWTDVDSTGWSGLNYSYTAGLSAVTNRATIINSYTLGDVHGDADQTNRAEAGGFVALDGGICINCYARGNVEVMSKYSMYLGGFVGMAASSSEHRQCYYNTDAAQKVAGKPVAEKRYAGKFVNESAEANAQAQTAAFLSSDGFAALLNANRDAISATLAQVRSVLGADANGSSKYHSVYYNGDASGLSVWALSGKIVGFASGSCDGGEYCPSKAFRDVDQTQWYHAAADYAIANGIFNGTSADTFEPNSTMTRGMLVTVLHRMQGSPVPKAAATFTDLKQGWYKDAVAWAAENGIVNGMGNRIFAPEQEITREQAMTMLMRYAKYTGVDVSKQAALTSFQDGASVSAWAKDAVCWAVAAELVQGMPDGTIQPQGRCTRAQIAMILMRFQTK